MLPSNYQGLLGCKVRPMTKEESEALLRCLLMEKNPPPWTEEKIVVEAGFGWNVLTKRLNLHGIKSTIAMRLCLLTLCENPAQAVLWAFTVAKIAEKNKFQQVTLEQLVHFFPDGIPEETEYSRLWRIQKRKTPPNGGMDNWLDYANVWPQQPVEAG